MFGGGGWWESNDLEVVQTSKWKDTKHMYIGEGCTVPPPSTLHLFQQPPNTNQRPRSSPKVATIEGLGGSVCSLNCCEAGGTSLSTPHCPCTPLGREHKVWPCWGTLRWNVVLLIMLIICLLDKQTESKWVISVNSHLLPRKNKWTSRLTCFLWCSSMDDCCVHWNGRGHVGSLLLGENSMESKW